MALINGFFSLTLKSGGVDINLYPPTDGGAPIDPLEVDRYLTNNRIEYEKTKLYDSIRDLDAKKTVRISSQSCYPINESMDVVISSDKLTAVARFYPPSDAGKALTYNDIISELGRFGVRYGAIDENIKKFITQRSYCTDYLLAKALPPEDGIDAVITYHFNTDLSTRPKHNEDGSVDFHTLDNINSIEEGDLIATLKPAFQGRPGIDVCGKPINQRKANVKFLRAVKNTKLSEDGLNLYSTKSGHVSLVDGQIFVSDIYQVPANVDTSTGDIKYNGNVVVAGNVNTGYRIEADGDVIVNGIVEGAEIIATGQIILKRGIQGMGRGILRAGGNVVTRFIESAEVYSGGYVQTDSIMHSKVEAVQEISVHGKKGFITGGSVKSGLYISAQTAGSIMGTSTILEVSAGNLQNDLKNLQTQRAELVENVDKASKVIAFISRKIKEGEKLTEEKAVQFKTLSAQKTEMENRIVSLDKKIEEALTAIDNASSGYILVDDIVYPGCKVTIGNVTNFIRNNTKHCRLVKDGADIRVKAY